MWRIGPPGRRLGLRPRPRRRPDRRRRARLDGAAGAGLFFVGYVVVAVVDAAARRHAPRPPSSVPGVVLWSSLIALAFGGPAHRGRLRPGRDLGRLRCPPSSARAPATALPRSWRPSWPSSAVGVPGRAAPSTSATAANVMSQLHTRRRRRRSSTASPTRCFAAQRDALLRLLPARPRLRGRRQHARLARPWSSLGPLPLFPLLAALPDDGADAGAGRRRWSALPPLVAAARRGAVRSAATPRCAGTRARCAAARGGDRSPASLFGCSPPGRRRGRPGPDAATSGRSRSTCWSHAITAFGIGGLLGGLAMTWWQRRAPSADGRPRLRRRDRSPRRPRLRRRHQPPGAARRVRRPGVRRRGGRRRRRPRRHRGAGPRRARRASRPSCTRSAHFTTPRALGPRAGRHRRRRTSPTWSSRPAS